MKSIGLLLHEIYTYCTVRRFGSFGMDPLFMTFSKFFVPKNIYIGNHVFINQQCLFAADEKIIIGNNVKIGFRCMFVTSNYETQYRCIRKKRLKYFEPIHIKNNVWIGSGAIILPGVTIGQGSVVGAGAVVTKNVADHTLVGGVPAVYIKAFKQKEQSWKKKDQIQTMSRPRIIA